MRSCLALNTLCANPSSNPGGVVAIASKTELHWHVNCIDSILQLQCRSVPLVGGMGVPF